MDQRDPITEWSKTLGGSGESNRVAIEPDDAEARVGGQERRAVTSTADAWRRRGRQPGTGAKSDTTSSRSHGNVFE